MSDKPTSLPMAILDYFGKKPGQSTAEFMQELKALTAEDKAELRVLLRAKGYPVVDAPLSQS